MTVTRRTFLQGLGALGALSANANFVNSVAAQAISSIRPAFSGQFRLASSPVIDQADISGIRLRWNFPLFDADGIFARCLPDRVLLHRKVDAIGNYFVPNTPDVGVEPISVFPEYAWRIKLIVQISSSPYVFEFRDRGQGTQSTVEGLRFKYEGTAVAFLKVFGLSGNCIVVTQIQPGQTFYFDAAEIVRFEIATTGTVNLVDAACLDITMGNEFNFEGPIAQLEIRQPLAQGIPLEEGALRLNGLAGSGGTTTTLPFGQDFLTGADWAELIALANEISASACSGAPEMFDMNGSIVAKTDLFLAAAMSRWEMAPRLGFGFRDGINFSRSQFDLQLDAELDLTLRNEVAFYRLEAIWDSGERLWSTVTSTRLDKTYSIGRPQSLQYLADVNGKVDSDYIAVEVNPANSMEATLPAEVVQIAQTTLNWQHVNLERTAGVLVEESYTGVGKKSEKSVEWLQHRGVFNAGFRGNVRRLLPVTFDDEVTAKIWSFDAWDRVSPDWIDVKPKVVLNYEPEAPRLACATHLASLEEADGKILLERLVTNSEFRPSCLSLVSMDGSAPLEFPDWMPDPLMLELVKSDFKFKLGIYESIARPKVATASISLYARDGLGSFVQLDQPIEIADFVGGFLDAANGRYYVRSFVGDRIYIGRHSKDLSIEFGEATCQLKSSAVNLDETDEPMIGACRLTQDYDQDEFWKLVDTVSDVDSIRIDYTFLLQALTPRPVEETDSVDYRMKIWGERNTDSITGGFSNVVSAQRLPRRPPAPMGLSVRLLGYDYYDRLLICCELDELDEVGMYAVQFAAGKFESVASFAKAAEQAVLIGPQLVGPSLTLFESLPIGRNFQTERIYTVGVSRVNRVGTFGPPATIAVKVPVE